jgi:hypothetical protein
MAKKLYLYSTLAADVAYTTYAEGGGDIPVAEGQVVVKGGSGVADARMFTPNGAVITPTDEETLARLRQSPVFLLHEKNGFITVSDKLKDGEVAATDMEARDVSAPLVPADFNPDEPQPSSNPTEQPQPAGRGNTRRA